MRIKRLFGIVALTGAGLIAIARCGDGAGGGGPPSQPPQPVLLPDGGLPDGGVPPPVPQPQPMPPYVNTPAPTRGQ